MAVMVPAFSKKVPPLIKTPFFAAFPIADTIATGVEITKHKGKLQKPFPPDKFDKEETKEIKESTTDPESGYYVKDERTKCFKLVHNHDA